MPGGHRTLLISLGHLANFQPGTNPPMRIYRRNKVDGKSRWFFWAVYLIVVLGVINAVPWMRDAGRWDALVLFVLILLFIAWRALQGGSRP